jgi:chromosome segregation ATPase
MGRSSALKNFVRENQKEGHVEIELKGRPGKRNMVIKRYLNSSDNSSKFEINGKVANKEAVVEAVADLNVNVKNLWYVTSRNPTSSVHD